MKMKTLYAALAGALLLGTATLAPAQKQPTEAGKAAQPSSMENKSAGISGDQYKQEKDRIEAEAKQAKAACKDMKDNAQDVCEAEAKAKEKVAKKELDYKKNPNERNRQDVAKVKAEAAYEVAKEKCEDQEGKAQADCKKQAKSEKDRAMAQAKGKKVADASRTSRANGSTTPATGASTRSNPDANASQQMSTGGSGSNVQTGQNPSAYQQGQAGTTDAAKTSSGSTGSASANQTKSGR